MLRAFGERTIKRRILVVVARVGIIPNTITTGGEKRANCNDLGGFKMVRKLHNDLRIINSLQRLYTHTVVKYSSSQRSTD